MIYSNTGGTALSISKIKIGGKNSYHFAQSNNCGASLAAGTSCTINVVSKPTASGGKSATLEVSDATGTKTVALSGKGLGLSSALSPKDKLVFADQPVGTVSLAQPVMFSNTGGMPLKIGSIKIGGKNPYHFAQSNNCGRVLAAGASCSIDVVSKPGARGGKSATLEVADATGTRTIALSGKGK